MTKACTSVRRHFSFRLFLTCRMRLRWKKQDLVMEDIRCFIESVLSKRTTRSTAAGLTEQSGPRLSMNKRFTKKFAIQRRIDAVIPSHGIWNGQHSQKQN